VMPGKQAGETPRVDIDPARPSRKLDKQPLTDGPSTRTTLVVDRKANGSTETVVVRGGVQAGSRAKTYYRSVSDPALYAGAVLRSQLGAVGIDVAGKTRKGVLPVGFVELFAYRGRPISEIVQLFMKYSNNAVAETLLKGLGVHRGATGSWSTGRSVVATRLRELGVDTKGLALVDGSGLSYENRITPRSLVQALKIGRDSFAFGPEWMAALPIANRDGTLKNRAGTSLGAVRAKTGLLNGVTALSGYAARPVPSGEQEMLLFSILVNGYRVADDRAMDAMDRFAAELSR
jgi:D-alanyl-D-alanine carboxypeptidase/D-alanyl-D-alanine-endopeptidase (penicillin-binding protein 4)